MTTEHTHAEASAAPPTPEAPRSALQVAAHGTGVRSWMRATMSAVGFGRGRPAPAPAVTTDRGTMLAERRTHVALDRTFMASERTLMAWMRTSLSMISFGFTIAKALEALQKSQGIALTGPAGHTYSPNTLGLALIAIGTVALVSAVLQHRATIKRMHAIGLQPRWSLALSVGGLLALLGVFAFGSIALHF